MIPATPPLLCNLDFWQARTTLIPRDIAATFGKLLHIAELTYKTCVSLTHILGSLSTIGVIGYGKGRVSWRCPTIIGRSPHRILLANEKFAASLSSPTCIFVGVRCLRVSEHESC